MRACWRKTINFDSRSSRERGNCGKPVETAWSRVLRALSFSQNPVEAKNAVVEKSSCPHTRWKTKWKMLKTLWKVWKTCFFAPFRQKCRAPDFSPRAPHSAPPPDFQRETAENRGEENSVEKCSKFFARFSPPIPTPVPPSFEQKSSNPGKTKTSAQQNGRRNPPPDWRTAPSEGGRLATNAGYMLKRRMAQGGIEVGGGVGRRRGAVKFRRNGQDRSLQVRQRPLSTRNVAVMAEAPKVPPRPRWGGTAGVCRMDANVILTGGPGVLDPWSAAAASKRRNLWFFQL